MITTEKLLRELETLTHNGRVQRMIELGRLQLAGGPEAAAIEQTLWTLESGDFFRRFMALQACYGNRDGAHALRALSDPSKKIRGLAIGLLPQTGNDEQVLTGLTSTDSKARRVLAFRLRKRRRTVVLETFLQQMLAEGQEKELVAQYLPGHVEAEAYNWTARARTQPSHTANLMLAQARALTQPDYRVLREATAVLAVLTQQLPERAVELAQALLKYFGINQLFLQKLLLQRPNAVADLVLSSTDRASLNFRPVLRRLQTEQLLRLYTEHSYVITQGYGQDWLKRLRPEQRRAFFLAFGRGWQQTDGEIPTSLLSRLPGDLREAETRRNLALPGLANDPTRRLPYIGFLPWPEVRDLLTPYLGDPDPNLRILAHQSLGTATRYQRSYLGDLLAIIRARRNEQDPIRLVMLTALAEMPPSSWQPSHLPELSGVIREALNAADLSRATAAQAEGLILKLLPFHPAWAAEWLATLVKERGYVSFYNLERRLTEPDVRRIAPFMTPVLQSWANRERESQLLGFAHSLGRRLRVFDELVTILVRLIDNTANAGTASTIVSLLALHRRDLVPTLIPDLLKKDPSWITVGAVQQYLHRWRQDLLTPFLGQRAYKGRFSTGKTRYLLPLRDGFHRWTLLQQTIFGQTLSEVAGDEMRDSPAIISTIYQLQGLLAIPPTRLIALSDDKRQPVRDTAVRALGRLDAGEGVPVLLGMMNDDRARIAIYALRRATLGMPPIQAMNILLAIPLTKVTVAKEVVRLLGELKIEAAYRQLLGMAGQPLHRDIRVAVLRGLWDYLERAETWPVLEQAAVDPDPAVATIVGRIPTDRLSATAQNRLARLLLVIMKHPEGRVRADVLARCQELPLTDQEGILLPGLLAALESPFPSDYIAAVSAIVATYTESAAPRVGMATSRIIGRRKVLETLVHYLRNVAMSRRRLLLPTVRAVLQTMATDHLTVGLQLRLAVPNLDGWELLKLIDEQAKQGQLHEEALMTAAQELTSLAYNTSVVGWVELEANLAASADPRLRRLGLATLIALSKQVKGWEEHLRQKLQTYRADPAPLVAAAAQFTFLPGEV